MYVRETKRIYVEREEIKSHLNEFRIIRYDHDILLVKAKCLMAGRLEPRTKGNAPHQPHLNKNTISTLSSAFDRRCSTEHNRLQSQLSQQLKEDIYKLSTSQLFWDLELEGSSKTILTHRCIVAARAPKFYTLHCSGKLRDTGHGSWRLHLPTGVSIELLGDFVRNIYTLEDPSDSETRVLSYLQHFSIGSPESETYKTPQCSPSDAKDCGFCEDNCEDLRVNLRRSSSHYYSLVPLDDDCKPSDLLEQELEEQDELIRSFQSIKENKKPSYLQLSSRQTKNNFLQATTCQQQTYSIVEETNQYTENCESEDLLLSCISSPCSLITPDMDPLSRTMDSGVDCGLPTEDQTMSISHPSLSSPILPRDHTNSETSGLEDGKQNCTTMASISDAESDHEFPDESADMEKSTLLAEDSTVGRNKEKTDVPEKRVQKERFENVEQLELENSDTTHFHSEAKSQNILSDANNSNFKIAEKLIANISVSCHIVEATDTVFSENLKSKPASSETSVNDEESSQCPQNITPCIPMDLIHDHELQLQPSDMPFCLVTSVEEFEARQIVLQDNKSSTHANTNPQFITYDINRSSNRSSGNFFIDASSLLDENEISSGDWLQGKQTEKLCIAGVTTTSSTDEHGIMKLEASSIVDAKLIDCNKVLYAEDSLQEARQESSISVNTFDNENEAAKSLKQDINSGLAEIKSSTMELVNAESFIDRTCTDVNEVASKYEKSDEDFVARPEYSLRSEEKIITNKEILSTTETNQVESDSRAIDACYREHSTLLNEEKDCASSKSSFSGDIGTEGSHSEMRNSVGSREDILLNRSFASIELDPICKKLETSVIDCKPRERVELGTCPSVDMIRSAPAAIDIKLREERPKSLDCSQLQTMTLPRRNTFELEVDDKQLVFIRQEIEKKQGQLLFQSCIPAFSQHVTGSEGKISGNKLPQTPPENSVPDECCFSSTVCDNEQQYSLVIPAAEEDINTPDSLNNDGPLENFSQENVTVNIMQSIATTETLKQEPKPVEIPRKQKYDESMPIVSGGLCTADFQIEVKESPQTRRRTESTPILSGANLAFTETPTSSPRLPRKIDSTAWVVDMSDPNSVKSPEVRRKRRNILPTQLETVKTSEPDTEISRRKNAPLGFFVDLSDSENKKKSPPPPEATKSAEDVDKKKSFFTMYVDIGDNKVKGQMPKRLERRVYSRETSREDPVLEQNKLEQEKTEDSSREKQSFYMFIEADSPVVRRQTMSGGKSNINRHSWNVEPRPNEEIKKHKRAQSLSIDKSFRFDDVQKPESSAKLKMQQSTQSLNEETQVSTDEIEMKPKIEYTDRSELRIMTRSMDETLTTEVKLRTGRIELEPVMESAEARKQFVRLSDLDGRGVMKHEMRQPGDGRARTRKVEETSWIESKLMVRGSRALARSKSPGSVASASLASCHSPNQDTDESELSSMQSSVDRSGLDASTEETDLSSSFPGRGGPCSRLGEDLLRMFLEEINTDVTVEVAGRRIRAHKCILSSRCQYFAAMLSGGWVESAGNVISLHGFSYHAVHFALSHIYSGTNNIPDSLSIVELATLTDMLGLEGLKEVIMYTLKVKYCHFFHKPCSVCAVGVLECLPLAAAYGLDDIYHKSLRWITKYFVRIWPSKAFASLPRELVDKCYLQHVVHMSVDTVLDTVMSCDRLLATLPSVRWAEAVFSLTSQLLEACVSFMAEHFSGVLTSDRFVSLGKELSWNISRLEDSIMAAVDCLPPEQACQSHTKLSRILAVAAAPEPPVEMQWSASFVELLERIKIRVEGVLVRLGARAMRCKAWPMLGANMRTKVQEAACLGHDPEEGRRARSLSLTKKGKRPRGTSINLFGTAPRYSGGRLIGAAPPSFDLRQVTLAMTRGERAVQPIVATVQPMPQRKGPEGCTNPEKPAAPKVRQARARTATETKQVAPNQDTTTAASGRPKTWPMKMLEQNKTRAPQKPNSDGSSTTASRTATPEKSTVPSRVKASSSESSRTSSPASRDKTRKGPAPRKPIEPIKSASSSHIPVANSKPFLSPVLRSSRETHDSPTSKSVSELTRTKNSPIPALRSRIMSRSSQPSLTDRRLSSGSIKINIKSSAVSSPSKPAPVISHQNSPLRKAVLTKSESPKPPFRLGTSTESLRKSNSLAEKQKLSVVNKHTLKSQENVSQSPKFDVKASPRARRLAEQTNTQDKKESKGFRKAMAPRAPIPLSQSSSAPAINRGFKPKLLSNTSRSGTFLKDEPTVLKKPIM